MHSTACVGGTPKPPNRSSPPDKFRSFRWTGPCTGRVCWRMNSRSVARPLSRPQREEGGWGLKPRAAQDGPNILCPAEEALFSLRTFWTEGEFGMTPGRIAACSGRRLLACRHFPCPSLEPSPSAGAMSPSASHPLVPSLCPAWPTLTSLLACPFPWEAQHLLLPPPPPSVYPLHHPGGPYAHFPDGVGLGWDPKRGKLLPPKASF